MIKVMTNETFDSTTWFENIVQSWLEINESVYLLISSHLQHEINKLDILNVRLNTCKVKNLLDQVFANVYKQFTDVFDNILKSQRNKCLVFIAQQCNYNKRRWVKTQTVVFMNEIQHIVTSFSISNSSSMSSSSINNINMHESVKTVQNIMIQVHCNISHSICCKSQDLLVSDIAKSMIEINDLNFMTFINLISLKLSYKKRKYTIFYECDDTANISIINEWEWKAAFTEMHTKKFLWFCFIIRRSEVISKISMYS